MSDFELIEYVKNGITILQPTIQTVVSVIISTLFLRKKKEITEIEKIKNKKFDEVIISLLENGKISYLEFYKCHNFLKVAKLADEEMNKKNNSENNNHQEKTSFDFDWLMRFFDAVGNISNENLQNLWAKLLVGEIQKPSSCSLRTLDIIRNMSSKEANIYFELCKYVLCSWDSYFILPFGFTDYDGFPEEKELNKECYEFIKDINLNYSTHIIPMYECGLLRGDNSLAVHITNDVKVSMHNEKIICHVNLSSSAEESAYFNEDVHFLTANGIELYNILKKSSGFNFDVEYATRCFNLIKTKYSKMNLSVEAYRIINRDGVLRYDGDISILR